MGHEPQDRVVETLTRIAFLLERAQASTYRSGAYRQAAAVVAGLPAEEFGRRAEEGAWTDLSGVGPSTSEVVVDVLRGRTPRTLADLEEDLADRLAAASPDGHRLRAALRGDLHSHTDASDGGAPLQDMALAAEAIGHDYLAVTDHSPRLRVANGLSAERLVKQVELVRAMNEVLAPFRLLAGIEVDVLDDGTLDQRPDLLERLDVVVASVHSKLRMDTAAMTRRMVAAVSGPHVDVLGHCTGRRVRGRTRPPSEFDAAAVFGACARHDVAVEVNARPDRQDPPEDLLALAADAGCLFAVDSDAHAPGQLDWQVDGCQRLATAGVGPERVVNTWSPGRLLEWTARR
ncbi:PHP domain-containing protein [Cellulomonas bogoriensis]|uniref:PHP domain-containing protein n=1 Tax=Cellulomonas bogoriensis TaxID=301388 RepID=UPI000554F019|nr:PHP domain-containing protein [Cellulomonas bogoriensis]